VGVLTGLTLIVAMLTGDGRVNVLSMTLIVAAFDLWLVSLVVWLLHPAQAATPAS
jgi:hypothetical protein